MNTTKLIEQNSALLHALGHPIRYCIVEQLINNSSNVNAMVNCLNVPQPTISQHLQLLKSAGIIEGKRDGKEIFYHVINEDAVKVIKVLNIEN
ncbi:MAG: winged helix-turn-helix transcriptional regulator [Spirochaetes bacterium]|nr:winged helix-turn-helix transcriptional regulator [Spirochaetota bacterium]